MKFGRPGKDRNRTVFGRPGEEDESISTGQPVPVGTSVRPGFDPGLIAEDQVDFDDDGHAHSGGQDGKQIDHANLTNVTSDQHHAQVHVLVGADHTASGLTTGHFLRATAATSFAFEAIEVWDTAHLGTVTTTDATITAVLTITPADNQVTHVKVRVVGRKSDGLKGAAYELAATFRRAGATTTQIGATSTPTTHEDDATWPGATAAASAANIVVSVQGITGETINWKARAMTVAVG